MASDKAAGLTATPAHTPQGPSITPTAILELRGGLIVRASPSAAHLLGYALADLLSSPLHDALGPPLAVRHLESAAPLQGTIGPVGCYPARLPGPPSLWAWSEALVNAQVETTPSLVVTLQPAYSQPVDLPTMTDALRAGATWSDGLTSLLSFLQQLLPDTTSAILSYDDEHQSYTPIAAVAAEGSGLPILGPHKEEGDLLTVAGRVAAFVRATRVETRLPDDPAVYLFPILGYGAPPTSLEALGGPAQADGILLVRSTTGRHLLAPEVILARRIAQQATLILRLERTQREIQHARKEMTILASLAQTMAAASSREEVAAGLAHAMKAALGADDVSCGIITNNGTTLELIAPPGIPSTTREGANPALRRESMDRDTGHLLIPLDHPAVAHCIQQHEVVCIPHDSRDPQADHNLAITAGQRSLALIPLVAQDQSIGLVLTQWTQTSHNLTASERNLALKIANQAAVALRRALALEAERRQAEIAAILNQVTTTIASSLDLGYVLERTLDALHQVVPYDSANIMVRAADAYVLLVARGYSAEGSLTETSWPTQDLVFVDRVVRTGKPVLLDDTAQAPGWIPIPGTEHVRSWLGVPLTVAGQVIGILCIDRSMPHAFTPDDQAVALSFAQHAAVAVHNARLYREMRQRTRRLVALQLALRSPTTARPADATLRSIAATMEELFDLGFVAILVPDTEGYLTIGAIRGAAVLRALRRAGIPFRRYRLDTRAKDNPLVIAYTQGQLQRIARATPMARGMTPPIDIDAIRRVWRETDMRWAIALPLIADDQCLGVVAACSPRPSELDHEELDILRTLAIQAGRALIGARIVEEQQHQLVEITRLHEQTARQARELAEAARQAEEHHTSLATIHRVAHVVAESLDMQRVLSDALEITMDIMRAAKGAIYLAEAGHIHTAIRRGFSSRFLKAAERFDLDRTAAGEAMRHGAPFIIESPSTDHRIHYTLARQELDAPTMYVPLKVRDMTLGVLLMTARPGCRYSERDLHLAEAIATEIALGLRNAQLYRAVVMAHQQTAAILTNIGEGVVAVNANGAITSFNPAAEGISAWSQDQAIGRPFEDIVGPCGNNQCPIRSILIGNGRDEGSIASAACEGWLTTHHGTLIAVARTCSILRAQDGQHMGAVMTIRDISREKELQRLRNDFVSMVSHNLRAPLTRIKTAAGMLANADIVQDMATRIRLLGIIRKEVDGLDHLTTDVLNVARLERGNLEVTCAPFLVSEIISDLVESFRLATRQHEFVVHGQTHLQAMGDRQKTLWVLENILDNAVKYSPAGGTIDITIQPWDEQGRQWVHIAVRDRGIGIPQEEQQRVFDAFYRIHTSDSQRVYGQGLGLYIARWLVEAQGGRIWLTSTPNRGTEVSFILPEAMGT